MPIFISSPFLRVKLSINIKKQIDFYYTIEKPKRAEIKIKGSRFIASAASVSSKEETNLFISAIRSEFFDATHNCFAYRIGWEGLEYRSSDDGEPSGSAGKPILFSIQKYDFNDSAVVVTRYFGGVKLGVGGLARAYSDAAQAVLETCKRKKINIVKPVKVFCSYEDISSVKKLIDEKAVKFEESYSDSVEYLVYLPVSIADSFSKNIISNTAGRAGIQIFDNIITIPG
jgi:uncharacterized YigZ family protein